MEKVRIAYKPLFLLRQDSGFCSLPWLGYLKTKWGDSVPYPKKNADLPEREVSACNIAFCKYRKAWFAGRLSLVHLSLKDGSPAGPKSESYRGSDFSELREDDVRAV